MEIIVKNIPQKIITVIFHHYAEIHTKETDDPDFRRLLIIYYKMNFESDTTKYVLGRRIRLIKELELSDIPLLKNDEE